MTATGRPRKNRTYSASWLRYIASPSVSASYSDSQSSPRNPLCTKRTVVVPDRPSMVNSSACITPSGPGVPSSAKRCGGSQAVMVDSETSPPNDWRTLPPEPRLDLVGRADPPAVELLPDGQGVPDLLRRGLDLDGLLDPERVRHLKPPAGTWWRRARARSGGWPGGRGASCRAARPRRDTGR